MDSGSSGGATPSVIGVAQDTVLSPSAAAGAGDFADLDAALSAAAAASSSSSTARGDVRGGGAGHGGVPDGDASAGWGGWGHELETTQAEQREVLGAGGELPPLAGGTSFGAEFVDQQRTRWKSRSQYVLVLMGYCIGVGNLWRFPYLCGRYGGGAFLVAYVLMLICCAFPLFFYESVLGQKFQRGPAETFRKMAPRWVGLAYLPVVMTVFYLPYYQMIVAYAFHYFLASFTWPLPWVDNTTPDKYLDDVVLWRTESLGSPGDGTLNGRLFLEVIVVWIITALCLVKGIHSAGKAAYVTVILPVIMLALLFCACITLEGASDGLYYYLTPRWSHLLNPEVWGLAAGQIIFSLSPGTGTCISLASYHSKEYKKIAEDAFFVAVCNSAFSIFGGFVVFSVVGNLSHTLGKPVEEVAASGEGLAFIVFAQGLAMVSGRWSQIFSILFFCTLFLLGLDSTFAVVETLQTYVNDWILARDPTRRISARGNALRLVLISISLLLVGIPYATRGGYYCLEIADHYIVTYSLTIGVLLEYVMIGHVYTAERMLEDVREVTGVVLPPWCAIHLKYVAPVALVWVVFLLLLSEVTGTSMTGYPTGTVFLFGVLPTGIAISAVIWPSLRFRLRRLIWTKLWPLMSDWTPEGLSGARLRARRGGFKDFEDMEEECGRRGGGGGGVAKEKAKDAEAAAPAAQTSAAA